MSLIKKLFSIYASLLLIILSGCGNNQNIPLAMFSNFPDVSLEISFFDSKDSVCILIEIDNYAIVIDSGLAESESALLEFISYYNISNIDYLILTHPVEDYIDRIQTISNYTNINQVVLPSFFQEDTNGSDSNLESVDFNILRLNQTEEFTITINGLILTVYPAFENEYSELINPSLITSIQYANQFLLFASDVTSNKLDSFMLESKLNSNIADSLEYTILLLPNHSSDTENLEDFLYSIKPTHGIISCSVSNQTSIELLQLLQRHGIQTFLSCDGKITIRMNQDSLHISQQLPKFTLL